MPSSLIRRAAVSGSLAAAAITAAVSYAGRRVTGSAASPLNATSHFLWGDDAAARQDGYSLKYTATGFVTNYAAAVFWALLYEGLAGPRPTPSRAIAAAATTAGVAYVTDYHVVPQRLTPGFELRLPPAALAGAYLALTVGLALRDLLGGRGR
jgi:hypothetical protein